MKRLAILGVLPLLGLFLLWGCENDTSNELVGPGGNAADKTCLGCHASETLLKEALGLDGKVSSPGHEKDGWSSDLPELEAWQKVLITGSNGTEFLNSVHGPNYTGHDTRHPLTCQHCHGGAADGTFDTMAEAHGGTFVADPSAPGEPACKACHADEDWTSACAGCHAQIAAANGNSLHTNVWGMRTALESRCAVDYENLTAAQRAGFQANCASCHTTCGQCHVSRPASAAGGFPLINGASSAHLFRRTPDMTEQCSACHGSRVGDDFTGAIAGNEPDVHQEAGDNCVTCHTAAELHGDNQHAGAHYTSRYQVATMPRCEDCHQSDVVVSTSTGCDRCHGDFSGDPVVPAQLVNHAHHAVGSGATCSHCHRPTVPSTTPPKMQCQVCHAQPYRNCTNCHNLTPAGGEYQMDPAVVQFKIALNPEAARSEYDVAVVRHVPVDPQTFAEWGLGLPSYTSEPTWVYTSPHNIRRATAQTAVADGQRCFSACHGTSEAPSRFLLRETDLYEVGGATPLPDYDANIDIVIPATFPGRP